MGGAAAEGNQLVTYCACSTVVPAHTSKEKNETREKAQWENEKRVNVTKTRRKMELIDGIY